VISDALAVVRARLAAAGATDVRIVAVTKGFGAGAVVDAVAAGVTDLGENYAQEVLTKFPEVARRIDLSGVDVHFIGQLQSNKVRPLAPWITRWDTVDRSGVVDVIARHCHGARVLVQVNATGEEGKGGAAPEEVEPLVHLAQGAGLRVDGLMTVGPTRGGPEAARPGFALVRGLVDRLGLDVCSMGMSDDLEVAVAEGSTEVRVGSALFGARPRRSDHGAVA